MEKTLPKPTGIDAKTDPRFLIGGRYGTTEMIKIWGPERTFQYSLDALAEGVNTMSRLHPDIANPAYAKEISENAKIGIIDPQRIRELEYETGHDIVAITKALEEKVCPSAASLPGQARTSADTTETAKAKQLQESLIVIADSIENLRDVVLEKSYDWINIPFMEETHLLDALPGVAGGIFSHYAEVLQSDLDFLKYVYKNSLKAKWADATGCHHSAKALGISGMKLEKEYCKSLGLNRMIAPAQVPAREFIMDNVYVVARTAETMNNLASYIAWGKSDDVDVFKDETPKKRKGSSAMPHKDAKGGNPTIDEQTESFANLTRGFMSTMLSSCKMRPKRDLTASASDRVTLETSFKFGDYVIRRLSSDVYNLGINEERSKERVLRTNGIVTSERILTLLTDQRKTKNPMPRSQAHDLLGKLATQAYENKTSFKKVLLQNEEVTSHLSKSVISRAANPLTYLGESKNIVKTVYQSFHKKKTL